VVSLGGDGLLPGPQHALAEGELAGYLGEDLAAIGDKADRLGLGLECEGSSCLDDRWSPEFILTLLTRRPLFGGKSIESLDGVADLIATIDTPE
jgi:hypothetical protein